MIEIINLFFNEIVLYELITFEAIWGVTAKNNISNLSNFGISDIDLYTIIFLCIFFFF